MSQLTDSEIYAAQVSRPQRLPDGFTINRPVRRAVVDYTFDANPQLNDLIKLIKLEPGAKLIPHLSRICGTSVGTALKLSLVDSNGGALVGAANALTAGGASFAGEPLEVTVPADGIIQAKVTEVDDAAEGDTLSFFLAFVQE